MTAFAAPERVPDGGYLDPDWYLSAYPELTTPEYTSKYPEPAKALATENPIDRACQLWIYHKYHGKDEGRTRVDTGVTTPAGNPTATTTTTARNGFESGGEFSAYSGGGLSSANAIASLNPTLTEVMPETETALEGVKALQSPGLKYYNSFNIG